MNAATAASFVSAQILGLAASLLAISGGIWLANAKQELAAAAFRAEHGMTEPN